MKKSVNLTFLCILVLIVISCHKQKRKTQQFEPTWESLNKYEIPQWYKDAKFGIFIHWGVYSVPSFNNEWYSRNMYVQGTAEFKHHREKYGDQSKFGYKDFIPMFTAKKWNPDEWAELFKSSGAKYVIPVAEHHDGFAMYASKISKWNAAEMGPKRDIVGELAKAVRKQGLIFGLSFHRAEHWWFMNGGRGYNSDVNDPKYADFYGPAQSQDLQPDSIYLKDWLARCKELVDNYHPQVFYFDWWIGQPAFKPYWRDFASYYYNKSNDWEKGVVINYKNDAYPDHTAVLDVERGKLGKKRKLHWQTDTSIGKKSWCYVEGEEYKNTSQIIHDLIDIVSKNGNLLLNIGPKPDGTIPQNIKDVLLNIGKWLRINGEGIYGTEPWLNFGEGPTKPGSGQFSDNDMANYTSEDFRFTLRGNTLYAFCMTWPRDKAVITSLGTGILKKMKVEEVSLLGCNEKLIWKQNEKALEIVLPKQKPCDAAYCFKIKLAGTAMSAIDLTNDAKDTVIAEFSLQNCLKTDLKTSAAFFVDGKLLSSKKLNLKPFSIKNVTFVYAQNQPGLYHLALVCNNDTIKSARIFMPGI
jgi:alpha-L-fucosidase